LFIIIERERGGRGRGRGRGRSARKRDIHVAEGRLKIETFVYIFNLTFFVKRVKCVKEG
jgi:hypothetical protein